MDSLIYDNTTYILVVDDDQTLLKFFKIHLNKFFSNVIVVNDAKKGLETLREKNIDLVITDIRMPKSNGLQLMKKIRIYDPTIPVFLISGGFLTDKQSQTVETKADGYLSKPFSIDGLHAFISKGLIFRDIYKNLFEIVPDKTKFQNLVRGKSFPNILDPEQRHRAKMLYTQILESESEKQAS